MEAVRLDAGRPVYETGHATHMYGPLLTVSLAGIFRVTGLNLLAGRIGFSIFAFALALLLSAVLCRGQNRKYWLIGLIFFLAINLRTNLIFLSAQPDCIAALLALGGLCLWARRGDSSARVASAIGLFVCAFLFKQTSAAFALIPFIHTLIWNQRFKNLLVSTTPAMSILLTLVAIRFIWPQVFHAIISVPGSIKVNYGLVLPITGYFIGTFPIFWLALLDKVMSRNPAGERERWIWAAILVLVPTSIWTICKSGGGYSSLLFGYVAMTALFVIRFDSICQWIASLRGWRSFLTSSAAAIAILLSFLIQFDRDLALLFTRAGDEKYTAAVDEVRQMSDRVISPQDPTIGYRGAGYFGRSLFFELDGHAVNGNWPSEVPESLQRELAEAKYVVQVNSYVPTPMFEQALVRNHFHPMDIAALRGSAYTFWKKE